MASTMDQQTASLSSLAAETSVSLEKIWDEVGLDASERAARLGQLEADVASLYRARVRAEEAERGDLRKQVEATAGQIETMSTQMQEAADLVSRFGWKQTTCGISAGVLRCRQRLAPNARLSSS